MTIPCVSGINHLSAIAVNLMDDNTCASHRAPLQAGEAASLLIFGKGVKQRCDQFKIPPSLILNRIADLTIERSTLH